MIRTQQPNVNPLVRIANVQEMEEAEAASDLQQAGENVRVDLQSESALAGHIRKVWERAKLHKGKVTQGMLAALRARRGLYSAAEIAEMQQAGGVNIVWVDLTETKCRAASAWIRDIVMPSGERAWGISPTPIPDLPEETKAAIVQKAAQKAREAMQSIFQGGGGVLSPNDFKQMAVDIGIEMRDETLKEYQKRAKRSSEGMEDKIADDMAQGDWEATMDGFVEDFVTYSGAVLKGPFYGRERELKWLPGFVPAVSNASRMKWARVSPFDAYPAPYATNCQDGDFIERIRLRPKELYDCIGLPGYRDDQIREALKHHRNGHLEGWIWSDAERHRLEQETLYTFLSPAGVIDGLHFWGSVPGWMVLSWGLEGVDTRDLEKEHEVEAIIVGSYLVRLAVNGNPLNIRPYYKASYDATPGAFWGRSIPDLCKTSQRMVNAHACAVADNLGMASGPMVWVHADRFADGEDSTSIFPWRIWQLKSDPQQGVNPGVGFFQANSNVSELMQSMDKWELKADDATGVPRYTYGNERIGGAGDTASGLSMLMNSAAKGLRRAISNIDIHVIGPSVYQAFVYNMLYTKDPSIKGDCVVMPRGANAILIKEAAQQHRQQALALVSGNPMLAQLVGPKGLASMLREVLKALDIDPDSTVPSDDDIDKNQQAQQQAAQQQQQALQQAEAQTAQLEMAKNQENNQTKLAIEAQRGNTQKTLAGAKIAGDLAKNTGNGQRDTAPE